MPLLRSYLDEGIVGRSNRRVPLTRIVHQTWTDPITASTNGHITTFAGPNTSTVTKVRGVGTDFNGARAGINDYARNAVVTVTHATAVVALSGVITGIDIYGKVIT